MSSEKTDALVIRVTDYSETSRIVAFLTREHGRISALAKGGRRLKGPFESALDLLSQCRIVFLRKSSSGLDLLTEAQLLSRFRPHHRSLGSLYAGYYVAELLLGLTEEYDPHPVLYDGAIETLARLESEPEHALTVLRFELLALRELGQLPIFDRCMACGRPVAEGTSSGFWVSQGGLICQNCRHEEFARVQIQTGTTAVLRRLSSDDETWKRLAVSPQQIKEMKHVTTAAISQILGHRPKMLRYLQF